MDTIQKIVYCDILNIRIMEIKNYEIKKKWKIKVLKI